LGSILELLVFVDDLDAMLIASGAWLLADGREVAVHGRGLGAVAGCGLLVLCVGCSRDGGRELKQLISKDVHPAVDKAWEPLGNGK
jgi:hypothetical protein